jgi:glycosyltransferase involved in cell wall biosynthesis
VISVVIPIHNEEPVIPQLLARTLAAARTWGEEFELVLVDDGSRDRSLELLVEAARREPHLRIVKLARNFGHQAAITAGIQQARGAAVIVMDGDLQDPPEELHKFIDKWREGHEVVYGIRQQRKEGLLMRFAYATFYRALHVISDIEIPLDSGDFCLMDRKVVDALNFALPEQVRFIRGLRAYVGFRQIGIAYERHERYAGTPSYTFKSLMKLAIDGLFSFSMFPLRLASYIGFLIAIPSFLTGIYFIVIRTFGIYVLGHTPEETPGLATLAVGLFFLSGLILIILGIMGEYLGRIYIEVKRRPLFVIDYVFSDQKTNAASGAPQMVDVPAGTMTTPAGAAPR